MTGEVCGQFPAISTSMYTLRAEAAKALRLYPAKGILAAGSDADLLLLDDDLQIREVYAMGKYMLRDGQMQVHVNFE